MSVITHLLDRLAASRDLPLIREIVADGGEVRAISATGAHLLERVACARGWLQGRGLKAGDRVAWVGPNGIDWVVLDLACLAEGLVGVPWYTRQDPRELAEYAEDCAVSVIVATPALADALRPHTARPIVRFDEVDGPPVTAPPAPRAPDDVLTLVYTSGTTGAAKGAKVTEANVAYMLPITATSLEKMMGTDLPVHRVFHYLPMCFMGSRVVAWTCLWRGNPLDLSTNLDNLPAELAFARPNYLLNVPLLLERMRSRVEAGVAGRPAPLRAVWEGAKRAALGSTRLRDRAALAIARRVIFPPIREKLGPELKCLICGSAPLAASTQAWFAMLGLPVYQVYGLTETTAIVTMDVPPDAAPGTVGRPIAGVSLRIGDDDELQARGPGIFPGYWGRDDDTRRAFTDDGWFRTGDQGSLDDGRLRITGRVKNVLVLTNGHKVAPEQIEEALKLHLPGAEQLVVLGHQKKALVALITGKISAPEADAALAALNAELPHYRRLAGYHLHPEPLTPESGMLTANQKLKRRAIEERFAAELALLYAGLGI